MSRELAHVARGADRLDTEGTGFGCDGRRAVTVDVGHDDVGARARERERGATPDAAPRARDDGGAPAQVLHRRHRPPW